MLILIYFSLYRTLYQYSQLAYCRQDQLLAEPLPRAWPAGLVMLSRTLLQTRKQQPMPLWLHCGIPAATERHCCLPPRQPLICYGTAIRICPEDGSVEDVPAAMALLTLNFFTFDCFVIQAPLLSQCRFVLNTISDKTVFLHLTVGWIMSS